MFIMIVVVIGGLRWMPVARLVRAQFLSLREKEFVEAARALGASKVRQVVRHILPNALGPVIVAATIDVAAAIIAESTLSFLGLGFPPDIPTWGRILYDAKDYLDIAPYWALFPGARDLPDRADDQLHRRRPARRARSAQGDVDGRAPLLEIRGLKTHFTTDDGMVQAVDGVDITIGRGETVGVVGESGCGKTVTALSVLKLIAMPPGKIVAGADPLSGARSRAARARDEMDRIRAKDIAMVFQEPMTSLNPVYTVGEQIAEVLRQHEGLSRKAALDEDRRDAAAGADPQPGPAACNDYPHQFSGGMRQRVMIAMALSCNPEAADRRRADHRARRHHPGADPRTAGRHEIALRHGDHADHPRDGRGGRDRAARRGDVCRQGDRGGTGRRSCSPIRAIPTRRA